MTSNSKEKSSNEQQLPAFLQGARPIPDSSSMGRSIILPKTTYVFSKEIPSKEFLKGTSKSKEIKSTEITEATKLAGVREIYNPNMGSNLKSSTSTPLLSTTEESSTLIFSFTSTTTTTPLP
uniref:Uncharacterized protein n=1 Tax=Panagrolaimus sp. PS1159 TaxID=55785 RepID=A0AC35GA34_9BILA